jgi:hypothetical protein
MCQETHFCSSETVYPLLSFLFVPGDLYVCYISFISGKVEIKSSRRPSTKYYERRRKSHRDVDVGEVSSRDPPLQRSTRETTHNNLPRDCMDIDLEIEEEEPLVESSDDDNVEYENYRISHRAARRVVLEGDDEDMDDADDVEDELRKVEEEEMEERGIHPQATAKIPFRPKPILRRAHKPLSYNAISYKGKGTMKEVKGIRKIDTRSQHKDAPDYRFHTRFQQNFYETVILTRKKHVSEAQWVDWSHMEQQDDPIFNQIMDSCTNLHIKELMGFKFDWNKEVIAQFFSTLYVEEVGNIRNMHWMTEGDWYSMCYGDFACRLGFGSGETNCPTIHYHQPLDEQEMKFMYAPDEKRNAGHINGLYTFYSILNWLFRKTICPRDGYPTNISFYTKNPLANMRDGALDFSAIDFVWEEIKGISMNPQKNCGFAPYIMFILRRRPIAILQRTDFICL